MSESALDDLSGDSPRIRSNTTGNDLAIEDSTGPQQAERHRPGLHGCTEDVATGAEAQSRDGALAEAYAEAQAHAQQLQADMGWSASPNGNELVHLTGQEVLRSPVSAVGAGSLAEPLLYLAMLSTSAKAVSIEGREQLREQLQMFLGEWANTMERREHLRLLGHAVAAVAASPILRLNSDEQERLSKVIATPSRVDARSIDHIEALFQDCKRQEDAFGSRLVLDTALAQRRMIHDLLNGCPSKLRPRLLSLYSDISTSIGYYYFDLNDLDSARYYCDQARVSSHEAGNIDLGIYALCEMSYFASWQGRAPASIDLAGSAEFLLNKTDNPLTRVGVAQRTATAYATDGQYKACMVKLERAQNNLMSVGQVSVESPLYFYNESYLASHRSECLLRLGRPQEAVVSASDGLIRYDKSFVDGYTLCMLHLGNARLLLGEVEEAARVIGEGALLATKTRSARLNSQLRAARGRMQPWENTAAVRELDERLRAWGMGGR